MSEKIVVDGAALRRKLEQDAKGVGIPAGTAMEIAGEITMRMMKWAKQRGMITEEDLYRQLAKITKAYNADLAYIYQSYGKII